MSCQPLRVINIRFGSSFQMRVSEYLCNHRREEIIFGTILAPTRPTSWTGSQFDCLKTSIRLKFGFWMVNTKSDKGLLSNQKLNWLSPTRQKRRLQNFKEARTYCFQLFCITVYISFSFDNEGNLDIYSLTSIQKT